MRHVLFVCAHRTLAGNTLFEAFKDWTISGLVQSTNWLDARNPRVITSLTQAGVTELETATWSAAGIGAHDTLDIFSVQLLIANDGIVSEQEVQESLSLISTLDNPGKNMMNVVIPTFGESSSIQDSVFKKNQNIIISPTDAHSPLTGFLEMSKGNHQYFQHAAKELASMAGIWPGMVERAAPQGFVSPGVEENLRFGRSFIRYVDASSLVDKITKEVLDVPDYLTPVAFDEGLNTELDRILSTEGISQVSAVADSFFRLFPELSYNPPSGERIPRATETGFLQALKLYFRWVFSWIRKQPSQLLQGFVHKRKAELAQKVQNLYGGEDSRIAVYVGEITAHSGQEWTSLNVTKKIQEAALRNNQTVKDAPSSPGPIWQTFFKTATALADGQDFSFQSSDSTSSLEMPRFAKGGRRTIGDPSLIVAQPSSRPFNIPMALHLSISGYTLTSEDPLLCWLALDEIKDVLKNGANVPATEKSKLIDLENDLQSWAKSNVSFSWLVGSRLGEGIYNGLRDWHRSQEAVNAKADDSKVAIAEENAQKALKNLLKGGLGFVLAAVGLGAGFSIWTIITTGALPILGAAWWVPVAVFSALFAIWNLLAASTLREAIREYFVLENNLLIAGNQVDRALRQKEFIWSEIHRLTSFYQQYSYWCKIMSAVVHRPRMITNKDHATSVLSSMHQLPAAMAVAELMPQEYSEGDMVDDVKRKFYKAGWIGESFSNIVARLGFNLNDLYADDTNLAVGPLTRLSVIFSDTEKVAQIFSEDSALRVQSISTSDRAYQQWRVKPLGMRESAGNETGESFIEALLPGSTQIPSGNLLSSSGQVLGSSDIDSQITFVAIDQRMMRDKDVRRIDSNELHPLDFVGVRVEFSKPFSAEKIRSSDEHIDKDDASIQNYKINRTEA